MIISCPSCATRYELPASRYGGDGTMIRCAACGHSWLEGRSVEIETMPLRQVPVTIEQGFEPDAEIQRLMEASREAAEKFRARRRQRRRRVQAWTAFAAALTVPFIAAAAFPEAVVRMAPAAVGAYRAIGAEVNIYGLDLRRVEMQHMVVDGTRVLAVKGEIANISRGERKIPSLRFSLRDATNAEIYHWTLDSGVRPLRAGEVTSFVTRVAAPPEPTKNVEIRFAHADEIGSTAAP